MFHVVFRKNQQHHSVFLENSDKQEAGSVLSSSSPFVLLWLLELRRHLVAGSCIAGALLVDFPRF